jgi:biotin carboxylase
MLEPSTSTSPSRPLTMLCISTFEKGAEFLRECKRQGCRVLLVTLDRLADANWPREVIDDMFYIRPDAPSDDYIKGISYLARSEIIDRIVALDDFDVETAALLREHLRVPGMGDTTARFFRDKLAMRVRARHTGILVPEFVHVLNYDAISRFVASVPPPWVLKPRSQASAIGIRKFTAPDELWRAIDELGDRQSFHLIEQYIAGDVYHVDAIVWNRAVCFAAAHKYGEPPMDVAHHGGVFVTQRVREDAPELVDLLAANGDVLAALRFVRGVCHTEFIRGQHDGRLYFLETAARVGGAHIVEVVEAATGVNLWREWARLEIAGEGGSYTSPRHDVRAAGLVLSLARQEQPDTSRYDDAEVVYRVQKPFHAGLIVASADPNRVEALLADYTRRFREDFFATAPLPDKPTS